ncbi:MAG: Inositol 2-dehydrogenase/D-chiro-inositol 3-dehydrogenase [Elusimicrobia bacterium]|nr:Inositol 2-dehydrogenase/D-chiro-inositol 3-dehydrogenase [Elusimicrobiota bacterium]
MAVKTAGVLIGYGSIGRRHAKSLAGETASLTIIDTKEAARKQAQIDFPQARVLSSLEEADKSGLIWAQSVPVIASWGPSHADFFEKLVERGVQRVLCEKPMASSVAAAHRMVQLAQEKNVTLSVNHFMRFSKVVPALYEFANKMGLGDPVSVTVDGGATCLATNGLHCIDFVSELYGASPVSVLSTAQGAAINPRSPDLQMFGGTAIWTFPDGREAVISFSNRSSLWLALRVFFRDTLLEMDIDLGAVIRVRDKAMVKQFPAITRTGPASEIIFQGVLPGVIPFEQRMKNAVLDTFKTGPRDCPGEVGFAAVSSVVGALVSAREKKSISLPLDPNSDVGKEIWPIS